MKVRVGSDLHGGKGGVEAGLRFRFCNRGRVIQNFSFGREKAEEKKREKGVMKCKVFLWCG